MNYRGATGYQEIFHRLGIDIVHVNLCDLRLKGTKIQISRFYVMKKYFKYNA